MIRLVLGRAGAATSVGLGMGIGIAGAYALRQLIATQLVGVSATDPVVIAGVAPFLGAVALLAAWSPARRASRVSPAEALRAE